MADIVTSTGLQDSERLSALIAEHVRNREAGQAPDLEALCRQHPDLADALRSSVSQAPPAEKRTGDRLQADGAAAAPTRGSTRSGAGSLASGATFGRYRVEKRVAESAMGAVYLAEDTQLRRPVTLKIPKFSDSMDGSARERFFREAQTARTLRHANICPVCDVGEIEGQHYIAMAYIGGRPLSDCLASGKPLQEKQAIAIVRKLALALTEAHSRGIVHGDLKSANVMIDEKGEPILMDFGFTQVEPSCGEARLAHAGTVIGAPADMPPEPVDGDPQQIDPRSDLYRLGVILYELLTAKLPFDGSVASVLPQVVSKAPRRPSELRPGLSPALEALTLQMLEKEADRRPADLAAVVRLLDKAAAAIREGNDANVALAEPSTEPAPKKAATASAAPAASPSGAKKSGDLKATRAHLAALASTARELIERHDYAQAVELVRGIPRDERTRELDQMLVEAHEFAEESEMLLGVIKEQVAAKKYDRLIPDLRRFLELKPGHRYAKELYATLQTYGDKGQRNFRYSNAGKLMPRESGLFDGAWMVPAIALGAFLLVSAFIYFSLGKGKTAVRVEVADELLKNGQVTLVIGDETVVIKGLSESITLTAGTHNYTVRRGDVEIVSPSQFVVRKGEQNLLRIGFGPGNEPPSAASSTTTAAATPAAATPATPAAVPKPVGAGDSFTNSIGMKLVRIPKGQFVRGSPDSDLDARPDEKPQHSVRITKDFYLGIHEVTQGQWIAIMNSEPWKGQPSIKEGEDYPAANISWNDAKAFCRKLSEKEGRLYRLPYDAEWEYAARGGTTTRFCSGDTPESLVDYAWFVRSNPKERYPHRVGTKKPNAFGLFDMHGNVQELCEGHGDVVGRPQPADGVFDDPDQSTDKGRPLKFRGGSFASIEGDCRSAARQLITGDARYESIGFRIATLQPQ